MYDDGLSFYVYPQHNGRYMVYSFYADNFDKSDLSWANDLDLSQYGDDLQSRARMVEEVAQHYGWDNIDSYPKDYSLEELMTYLPNTSDVHQLANEIYELRGAK